MNETILARKADDFNLQENIVDGNTLGLKLKYYVSGIPVTFNLCLNIASREEVCYTFLIFFFQLELYKCLVPAFRKHFASSLEELITTL